MNFASAKNPRFMRWQTLLLVAVLCAAGLALTHELKAFSWPVIRKEISTIPFAFFCMSIGFSLLSHALLTIFDWQGLRAVGKRVAASQIVITAFFANAVGHTLGMAPITGGLVRLKGYHDADVTMADTAQIVFFSSAGFAIGAWFLFALGCLAAPQLVAHALFGRVANWQSVGVCMLVLMIWAWLTLGPAAGELRFRKLKLLLPARTDGAICLVVSVVELGVACMALYCLLPTGTLVTPSEVLFAYVVALIAGIISTAPGGIGVFELTMLTLLPMIPKHTLVAAMLVYRLNYYVIPLMLALSAALCGSVIARNKGGVSLNKLRALFAGFAQFLPALLGWSVTGCGFALLFAGVLPRLPAHAAVYVQSTAVLELSHFAASLIGTLLLPLGYFLIERNRGAWLVSSTLLVLAGGFSTLRGDSIGLGIIVFCIAITLILARAAFYRRSALSDLNLSVAWWLRTLVCAALMFALMMFAHRNVPYQNELWWQFALDASAPRALRAFLLLMLGLAAVGLLQLLRPSRQPPQFPSILALDQLAARLGALHETQGLLALSGDKALLYSAHNDGFLMYQQQGRSLIALGDPVVLAESAKDDAAPTDFSAPQVRTAVQIQDELRWAFRELADQRGLNCVFYQVSGLKLQSYLDLGLSAIKLGVEALVPLSTFNLDGKARAPLRQAHKRAQRDGLSFMTISAAQAVEWMPELQRVSTQWLARKNAREKGFSLGFFAPHYIQRFPQALVLLGEQLVAFANIWQAPAGGELSIDLMRFSDDAPKGTMDYLFIELMLWGKTQGFKHFNLGMAPLSGLTQHRLAQRWQRWLGFFANHGERFYGFAGLRHYKEKFDPLWQPRYLIAPAGWHSAEVMFDVTRLIGKRRPRAVNIPSHIDTAPYTYATSDVFALKP